MWKDYYLKPKTVDRIRQSWIAIEIERYLTWMEEQRHAVRTIHRRIPLLVQFGDYTKERGATSVTDLANHVSDFVCHFEQRSHVCRSGERQKVFKREVHGCIRQMLSIVLPGYDGQSRSRRTYAPRFGFVEGLLSFLQEERGLSKASLRVYDYWKRVEDNSAQAIRNTFQKLLPGVQTTAFCS